MAHARYRASVDRVGPALWAAGAVGLSFVARTRNWAAGEIVLAAGLWLIVLVVAARDFVRQLFGPVFAYEILRLGRRRGTFIARGLYVLAACGLLALMYLSWLEEINYFSPSTPEGISPVLLANFSARYFYAFQFLQLGAAAFFTPAFVAGAIADEKERKTLEFLLATDLTPREIVFGKLAARVATLLMFVAAGLPVLAFLQLFGGIDPDLLLAGTAATGVTVVGLSAWSVCLSVLSERSRDAVALTYLTALVYAAATTTAGVLVRNLLSTATVTVGGHSVDAADLTDWLAAGNVGYVIITMSGPAGTGWVLDALGRYAAWWAVATVVLIGVAVVRLRPVALRQAPGGSERKSKARPRRPVGDDPMYWKEVFVEGGGRGSVVGRLTSVVVVGLVFAVPVLIGMTHFGDSIPWVRDQLDLQPQAGDWSMRWSRFRDGMSAWVRVGTGVVGALALFAAAVRGAGAVTGERDRDTWVSLVGTPLTAREMLVGKWWGVVLGPRRIYVLLAVMWAVAVAAGAMRVLMLPVLVVTTAVYVAAFAWLGIFFSVSCRTTLAATVRAIAAAAFVGGGFWFAFGLCCMLPLEFSGAARDTGEIIENVAQLMLGATPPFVLGWLPLNEFAGKHLGPLTWDQHVAIFGPLAPVFGTVGWVAFAARLSLLCRRRFEVLANRVPGRAVRRPLHPEAVRPST